MLFGRKRPERPVIDFWTWWVDARPRLTAALAAGNGGMPMVDEISRRVRAVGAKLDWELGQGAVAQHALTVSCAGNAELRATAARWLALAPPPDETWEFHDTRQPNPDFEGAVLRIDGRDIALGDIRFVASPRQHSVDVAVFHPAFADLADGARTRVGLLALDWALGEQAAEIWVGRIEVATAPPAVPFTVEELRGAIAELKDRHTEPQWAMLTGESRDGQPILATTQVPLRAARWPRFDTHVALTIPFEDRGNGLPTGAALEALRAFEDVLASQLADDGQLLAHETSRSIRTLHYYVDGHTELPATLAKAASGWPGGRATSAPDPSLKAIRHLDADR